MKKSIKITIIGIIFNTFLFVVKLIGGIYSNSLALISDSLNSFMDIMSSSAIFFAVRVGMKNADLDHPFGHKRAEPIAGLLVAILSAILGFEVIKNAFEGFFITKILEINYLIYIVIAVSMVSKLYLYLQFFLEGKKSKSPALISSSIDYRNDILISFSVFIGILFGYLGYPGVDNIVALFIGAFVIFSGFKIGLGNVDFLMGKKPDDEIIDKLKRIALNIEGVRSLNEVKAHFLGNIIQVEIHIEVDKKLSTEKSHDIAKEVQDRLQNEDIVDYAFVHIDPV